MPAESGPTDDATPVGPSVAVDLVALLRRPGTRRSVEIDEHPQGLRTSVASIDSIRATLTVESMGEKVTATGGLTIDWTGDCRRCLDVATGTTTVDLQEVFEPRPVEGETYQLPRDDVLDLGPMIVEQALLTLPLAPLCRDDCPGPAPDLYPAALEEDELRDAEAEPVPDPRWAALDELSFDDD